MNAQDQANIDWLNKLLALPPADWIATKAEPEADGLLESLEKSLGKEHPLVQDLDRKFFLAQEASENWRKNANAEQVIPQPTANIPPTDPALLQDKTPLGVALGTLVGQGRFDLRRRLQSGYFSAGYSALDRQTSAHVVVKLPTNEDYTWTSRFRECDDALVTEATILPLANSVINAVPTGSARPVAHVAAGELSIVQVWPLPVHWLAQRFAQGQCVSEIVPMREAREVDGLRILRQVTTMTRHLYAANLAHCDLKEDALFWDGTHVEVIDWNRATRQPTKDELQREFEALQHLTSTIFYGLSHAWGTTKASFSSEAHAYASELLVTFSGLPLSRGTRMLLFRSMSAYHPAAITTVDALHTAVTEQCVYWDQPTAQQPVTSEQTPRAISALLDRVAVEFQRPTDTSLVPAERLTWMIESYAQAHTEAIRHLRIWLSVPEDLRTSFPKLEAAWFWLPDVWPLALLVPLSKLWFFHVARELDNQLAKLASQIVADQLEDAAATARHLASLMPPPLAEFLQQTAKSAGAYLTLDRIELAVKAEQPDYVATLRTLKHVRESIPFELRTLVVLRLLDAGDQRSGRTILLREELDQMSRLAPDLSQTQRRLLATLEELRGLGRDDPRYASQQQTVKVLDAVEAALAAARPYADAQAWDDVITRLEPWHNRPDLRDVARDLYAKVEKLFGDAEDYRIYRHRREFFEHVQNALALGDLKQIQRLCKDAHQTLDRNEIVRAQITALEQALPVLTNAITALQSGDVAKITKLKPEVYPEICYLLVQQINAIYQAARYLKLAQNSNTDIDSAQKALTQALQIPPDVPLPLRDIRRTLITEAGERMRELLHKQITSGATLTSEELGRYEEALSQVQAVVGSVEPGLLTSQVLLAQRREQMLTAQVAQGQTGLTTALGTTSGQISGAIGQVKTDLGTKVSALETSISTLTSISAQQSLAGKADLTRIGGAITNQLDDLAKQDAAIAAAVRTITQHIDSLRGNDKVLMQGQKVISDKLGACEKAIKPQPSLIPVAAVGATVVGIIVLVAFLVGMVFQYRLSDATNIAVVITPHVVTIATPKPTITATPKPTITATAATVATAEVQTPNANVAVTTTVQNPSPEVIPGSPSVFPTEDTIPNPPVVLYNMLVAHLGQTVYLPTGIDGASGRAMLVIVNSISFELPVTAQTAKEPASIAISETLLLTNTLDFALPITTTLRIGDMLMLPLRIEPSVLTMGKVVERGGESEYGPRGELWALLWNDPSKRNNLLQDTVKINGAMPNQPNFVVLLQSDQIKLLEGKGDFYKIEVVTNKADGPKAIGQIGWIRKTLVHGGIQ
ncbi:MAG: hypothetical protein WCK70_15035 [Chloroflexales bacterium]